MRMPMKLAEVSDDLRALIVQLYDEQRWNVPAILRHLDEQRIDMTSSMVYKVLRARRVPMRSSKVKRRDDVPSGEVKDLAAHGFTREEIGAMYGASPFLVMNRLREGTPQEQWRRIPRRSPKAQAVADDLLRGIEDGEFPVDERLPPETVLAVRYSVSRDTVRSAVAILREAGRVETLRRGSAGFSASYVLPLP
jgi:hypothetical protein